MPLGVLPCDEVAGMFKSRASLLCLAETGDGDMVFVVGFIEQVIDKQETQNPLCGPD